MDGQSGFSDAIDDDAPTDCASRALITSVPAPDVHSRTTAIVLAEDLATGEVLRCNVILDAIDALAVRTTTRELYLEEAPEQFELSAHDAQGNEFSTLEGVAFDWLIDSDSASTRVLQFLRFAQSAYHEVPASVAKFEAHYTGDDRRGFLTLLEGVNTGTARVIVRLPYAEYANVPAIHVDLTVLANIILDPIDAHIMVGDRIAFRILQLKQGKLHEITASKNQQYYLEVEDTDLATIAGTVAEGQKLGRTTVVLRDRNVGQRVASGQQPIPAPRATLTVCEPARLQLSLLPHNNWVTLAGRRHDIAVDLYASDNRRIHLGTEVRVHAQFNQAQFYPIARTANGSRVYGEAVEVGTSEVRAMFAAGSLEATARLEVYAELELQPALVVLPWLPKSATHGGRQPVQFRATGGDGQFTWTTANAKLVALSQAGLAEARLDQAAVGGDAPPVTHVQVALTRNLKLTRRADIVFVLPERLSIVAYNFETPLDDYVDLHVALFASHNGQEVAFTACDTLRFELEFGHDIFSHVVGADVRAAPLQDGACQLVRVHATALGQTTLRISYRYDAQAPALADTVTLVVHEPLAIFSPAANEIVLPIGASRAVVYQHGPQPLFNVAADYQRNVHFDEGVIAVERRHYTGSAQAHVFTVLCRTVGETTLQLRLHNRLAASNYRERIAQFETHVHCVKPRFVNLFTAEKMRDGCPLHRSNAAMHVQRSADDRLQVDFEVLDEHNRRLQNTSSLQLEWHILSGGSGGADEAVQTWRHADTTDVIAGVPVPARDYVITALPAGKTEYRIRGSVVAYDAATLRRHQIVAERPAFGVQKSGDAAPLQPIIENELNFMAVNGTLLPMEELSIFLGASGAEGAAAGQRSVAIRQGSGHYEVRLNEQGVVRAELNADATALVVTPLKLGKVRVIVFSFESGDF